MTIYIPPRALGAPTEFQTWDEVKNTDVSIPGTSSVNIGLWHEGMMEVGYNEYSLTILSNSKEDEELAQTWLGDALLKQLNEEVPEPTVKGISKMTSLFRPDIGLFVTNITVMYKG